MQRNTEHEELMQLQARLKELKGHNKTLQKELEKAAQDKENLQNMYNNYMMRVQSLLIKRPLKHQGKEEIMAFLVMFINTLNKYKLLMI